MHILINGANLFVEQAGNAAGPNVVFLHGFPFSHVIWDDQVRAIGPVHRTTTYDLRGHGQSDVGDGQYSVEGHVDDLFTLLDALKIEKPVIVGLSMGGYIILRALERDQQRFRAAVLCDTRSEADTNEVKVRRFKAMAAVKAADSESFAKEFVKSMLTPDADTRVPDAVKEIISIISHTPPLAIAGTQLALASRTDTTASLGDLRLPVLILVGEQDPVTPVSAAEAMRARIPGAELAVVPGASHLSNMENPSFFNERLIAFLQRVQSKQ